jgi:hypothetical protein
VDHQIEHTVGLLKILKRKKEVENEMKDTQVVEREDEEKAERKKRCIRKIWVIRRGRRRRVQNNGGDEREKEKEKEKE